MSTKTRRQQLEEMLTLEPNDAFLRYGLAMELKSAGDDEGAVRAFEELFRVDPNYVPGYMQAGQALTRLGRVDAARAMFERGCVVAQKNNDLHALEEMRGFMANLE